MMANVPAAQSWSRDRRSRKGAAAITAAKRSRLEKKRRPAARHRVDFIMVTRLPRISSMTHTAGTENAQQM
jgi:hypothetical protein